jgi:hypothetical protein
MSLQNIAYIFLVRLPERAYNLIFRCDWRPVRFLLSLVFFSTAYLQVSISISVVHLLPLFLVYCIAAPTSLFFGIFYLYISTNDRAAHEKMSMKRRYVIEFAMPLTWAWVFFVEWNARDYGLLIMDSNAWISYVEQNFIVITALACSSLNAFSLVKQEEIEAKHG